MFLEIAEDVRNEIYSFLSIKDFYSFTSTCKELLEERKRNNYLLKDIMPNHFKWLPIDEEFMRKCIIAYKMKNLTNCLLPHYFLTLISHSYNVKHFRFNFSQIMKLIKSEIYTVDSKVLLDFINEVDINENKIQENHYKINFRTKKVTLEGFDVPKLFFEKYFIKIFKGVEELIINSYTCFYTINILDQLPFLRKLVISGFSSEYHSTFDKIPSSLISLKCTGRYTGHNFLLHLELYYHKFTFLKKLEIQLSHHSDLTHVFVNYYHSKIVLPNLKKLIIRLTSVSDYPVPVEPHHSDFSKQFLDMMISWCKNLETLHIIGIFDFWKNLSFPLKKIGLFLHQFTLFSDCIEKTIPPYMNGIPMKIFFYYEHCAQMNPLYYYVKDQVVSMQIWLKYDEKKKLQPEMQNTMQIEETLNPEQALFASLPSLPLLEKISIKNCTTDSNCKFLPNSFLDIFLKTILQDKYPKLKKIKMDVSSIKNLNFQNFYSKVFHFNPKIQICYNNLKN